MTKEQEDQILDNPEPSQGYPDAAQIKAAPDAAMFDIIQVEFESRAMLALDLFPELVAALELQLFIAENADETGYVTDSGFIDVDAEREKVRELLARAKGEAVTPAPAVPDALVAVAMLRFGGRFVQNLAMAWQSACPEDRARIKAPFPAIWAEFSAKVGEE